MLQSNINWGQYSDDRQRAYDRLADTRQRQLDAEVKAHNERAAQGTDSQQLGALAVQGGLAYATGGASLAYAPLIDKASWTAMGKPQAAGTGISGMASTLGQVGYGIGQANKAEALADADKAFENDMAGLERLYKVSMEQGGKEGREQAQAIALRMNQMSDAYQGNREKYKESGFLGHLFPDSDDPMQGPSHGLAPQQTPQDVEMANVAQQKQSIQAQEDQNKISQGYMEHAIRTNVDNRPVDFYRGTEHESSVADIVASAENRALKESAAEVDPMSLSPTTSDNPNRGKRFRGRDGRVYGYDAEGNPVPLIEG